MTHRLRGALIGTGFSARHQLRAWTQIESADIVAIAGETLAAAQKQADVFNIAAAYGDYQAMLANEAIDFVDLATPPATHEEMVLASASRGLHVLCQKPVSEDLSSLSRMISACEDAGVVFAVNENCRFQPWFRRMRQLIDRGDIGQPVAARIIVRSRLSVPTPRFVDQPFFLTMPRLVIFELGVHFLDTARFLLGPAQSVYATVRRISPHLMGEDTAVMLTTHTEAIATIDLSWALHPMWDSMGIGWADVTLDGTEGMIHLDVGGSMRIVTDTGASTESFNGDVIGEGYRAAQAHFVDCLRQGREPETSGTDQYQTMVLVLGAYESATSGEVFHVESSSFNSPRLHSTG